MPGKKVVPSETIVIEKGLPASELIELLGEPEEVRDVEAPREGFEVWVYTQVVKSTEYVGTDRISPETSTVTAETQFLIADGFVVGWKRKKDVDFNYD
ncbi:hypothetical protein VDG1235_2649 [Verrucomicrobiia bacterium DG1235]|nr:hypothetical protein VDG1235_2649 [Verrucomicrobiae bacterium DG1235]